MQQILCFHNPDESYGYLSNWWLSEFQIKNHTFSSLEQYMMYEKAICFQDIETAQQILETKDVGKIKALGRAVKQYEDSVWNGIRQIVVYRGLLEKFKQNSDLKEKLLETGDAILAECAVRDCIWGIGLSMKDERRFDRSQWKGQNLLGYTLMEVRKELQLL